MRTCTYTFSFILVLAIAVLAGCDTTGVIPPNGSVGSGGAPAVSPDTVGAVTDLSASVDGRSVHLTWTPPATNALRAIEIYRLPANPDAPDSFDYVDPYASLSPFSTELHDELPEEGIYQYYVVTRYHGISEYGESAVAVASN